ncbi:LOW QUALITY PROTEIN: hypothetical protein OSB04_018163 [Centaurea solstitialis]|uniref:Zinc finger PHD-type domain-containing protein n=1 Tax=Centaurea solstitialis TaxID=347529 RepID=A0AA38TBV2_9ASTR|nr:LOW QUALITY PROTEIN: hypothetical protein OSB04_018163 [Centaurea solstitialis]
MATLEACINNNNGSSRKRKQRIFEFKSFTKSIIDLSAPFRDNIRSFLDEYGEQIESNSKQTGIDSNNNVWSTLLLCESNGAVFPLYTIEEHINDRSVSPFCCHCKSIGWGHHFVCKRRYRFLIPSYGEKPPLMDRDHDQKKNNLELDDTSILHGLIHCNGFGHLISINKLEFGSSVCLSETDVMDFWDGICNSLKTRKVSVADVKLERSMELRLIHGVAFENSWFGDWGYKFANGGFDLTEDKYRGAVRFLAELELDKIINDFRITCHGRKIQQIIRKYRELSETPLTYLNQLLRFLLQFKPTAHIQTRITTPSRKIAKYERSTSDEESENPKGFDEFLSSLMDADCRWPQRRVEYSLEVIVKLLKQKSDAISRHELRESARQFVGDTGLIDFVLKSIDVLRFEDYIIRRVVNSSTRLVEFEIHEVAPEDSKTVVKCVSSLWKLEPRWPKQRLEKTAKVIANILKEHKILGNGRNAAMSRKDLRNMASKYVGDTGLIDFVLKSIDNLVIGKQIVTRMKNPLTRLMEFEIRDQNRKESEREGGGYGDLLFLYRNVLLGYPWWDSVSRACRVVLNSKYFVKEWEFGVGNDQVMTLTCRVLPSFDELETELTRPLPPGELVVVPRWMTVGQLREVAQCALRDTCCIMESEANWRVERDTGRGGAIVRGGGWAQVWVRGCGLDLGTALRYEGGDGYAVESTVDCECGARDDDGERMVACDECHVWKHTRCCGIEDDEAAPMEFVCSECDAKSKSDLLSQKVSVADVKLERSMELRLIHGVAFENSWFGNWGYKFANGGFDLTEDKYRGAVRFLAELELDKIINDFRITCHGRRIQQIIRKYRELSETPLTYLNQLLRFLLQFKPTAHIQTRITTPSRKIAKYEHSTSDEESENPKGFDEFLSSLMDADCRWPQRRVEYSLEVIVKLLKQKNDAISRHELRESARQFVGDTGLIDFVLKSIDVLRFEDYIIRRVVNSSTRLVEFEIHEVAPEDSKTVVKCVSSLWKLEPRWPKQRLEKTAKVIANILKEHKILGNGRNGAMSRKDLRNMASKYVGDTGLIDFVLKSIDNLVIGKQIVTRMKNPLTRLMEFEIRDQNCKESEREGVVMEISCFCIEMFYWVTPGGTQ